MITDKTLKEWGFRPGPWFKGMVDSGNSLVAGGLGLEEVRVQLQSMVPAERQTIPLRTNKRVFGVFVEPENEVEQENLDGVIRAMDELMRVPTVEKAVVMPDACPAGVIPVGGVVATKDAIHPGFHSSDTCCSMAITVFKRMDDLKNVLDVANGVTHFGPGGRKVDPFKVPDDLLRRMDENSFMRSIVRADKDYVGSNLGTQGDGNHFLFVGTLRSTGQPAIVTHHGSRGPGAALYRMGMAAAKRHTSIVSPRTPEKAAWIDANSDVGRDYWEALQLIREWTKLNHFVLHDEIQQRLGNKIVDRFWNEHNFVFRRDDGLFYHAKGSTPSFKGFSPDDDGRTLIPMNMAEPIMITTHRDNPASLGFSPHGAGRNFSRTRHIGNLQQRFPSDTRGLSPRDVQAIFEDETKGLDVRAYLGKPDVSELPSAYKSAEQVRQQIVKHDLASIVDHVDPYGCIMAGEITWGKRR